MPDKSIPFWSELGAEAPLDLVVSGAEKSSGATSGTTTGVASGATAGVASGATSGATGAIASGTTTGALATTEGVASGTLKSLGAEGL
jgi:hypothetical protein